MNKKSILITVGSAICGVGAFIFGILQSVEESKEYEKKKKELSKYDLFPQIEHVHRQYLRLDIYDHYLCCSQ